MIRSYLGAARNGGQTTLFVTVVAVMCHLLGAGAEPVCIEEIVTDSAMTEGLTFMSCMVGAQAPLAKWKSEHPIYRAEKWTIGRYKCVPGRYELHGKA